MEVLTKRLIAAAVCLACSLSLSASATTSNVKITQTSSRVVTLETNSAAYQGWSAWIRSQNAQNPSTANLPAGRITLEITQSATSSAGALAMADAPPLPVSLPATGTPGERLTITSQTNGVYQQWIVRWVSGGSGSGGVSAGGGSWQVTGYQVYDCNSNINTQSECQPGG